MLRDCQIIYNGQVVFENEDSDIESFLDRAYKKIDPGYPKFYKMDRLSKFGLIAGEILLQNRSLLQLYAPEDISLILSNANASLDTDIRYFETIKDIPSPSLFVYTLPNIVTGELCIRHGFKGENAFFVSEQFNADLISNYVDQLLSEGNAKACLAGWIDVLGDRYDVFLYLAENHQTGDGIPHTQEILTKLYNGDYGTVDVKS